MTSQSQLTEFRNRVQSLFSFKHLTDDEIIERIRSRSDDLFNAMQLIDRIKTELSVDQSAGDDEIITEIQKLTAKPDSKYLDDSGDIASSQNPVKSDNQGSDALNNIAYVFDFHKQVMIALGNPDDAIAQIKELAEIKAEIARGNIANEDRDFKNKIKALFGSYLSDEKIFEVIETRRKDQIELNDFVADVKKALLKLAKDGEFDDIEEINNKLALTKIKQLVGRAKVWQRDDEITQFALEVKQFLIDQVGKSLSDEEAIAEIKHLQEFSINAKKALPENGALSDDAFIDSVYELRCERTYYRSILDHLCNRLELHGADAFEELKQVEVRGLKSFATLEAENQQLKQEYRQKVDEYHQEVSSLVDKLRIANKVIARLVGE